MLQTARLHSSHVTVLLGQIISGSDECKYLDTRDPSCCNWRIYFRAARLRCEQNLVAYQYRGAIYFESVHEIAKGDDLRVAYSSNYEQMIRLRCPQAIEHPLFGGDAGSLFGGDPERSGVPGASRDTPTAATANCRESGTPPANLATPQASLVSVSLVDLLDSARANKHSIEGVPGNAGTQSFLSTPNASLLAAFSSDLACTALLPNSAVLDVCYELSLSTGGGGIAVSDQQDALHALRVLYQTATPANEFALLTDATTQAAPTASCGKPVTPKTPGNMGLPPGAGSIGQPPATTSGSGTQWFFPLEDSNTPAFPLFGNTCLPSSLSGGFSPPPCSLFARSCPVKLLPISRYPAICLPATSWPASAPVTGSTRN